jgi:hypothetical protein
MLKYLRIAVTALSLTACGLLVVFWVRSNTTRVDFWYWKFAINRPSVVIGVNQWPTTSACCRAASRAQ